VLFEAEYLGEFAVVCRAGVGWLAFAVPYATLHCAHPPVPVSLPPLPPLVSAASSPVLQPALGTFVPVSNKHISILSHRTWGIDCDNPGDERYAVNEERC